MTLRVAFIGAGQMARHHAAAIERSATRAEIVGVFDRASDRAGEFAAVARTRAFTSMDALFAEARPDIVHVCTPPETHVDAAYAALDRGAHVYVEKPFAPTVGDAWTLLEKARDRNLLVCAGHQLLHDPGYVALAASAPRLGELVQVDSHFAFRPAGASSMRRGPWTLARQLIDILPHPLYVLAAALERFSPEAHPIDLAWADAGPTEVQAILRSGRVTGRLSVSLRARPVASWLTLVGTDGSRSCDFVRSIVTGAGNPGTEALEKIFNPMLEGTQLATRTASSVAHRIRTGLSYPGLGELIGAFHHAVATNGVSPVSPEHLLQVTTLFEELVARIEGAAQAHPERGARAGRIPSRGRVLVTGARGFLGGEIVRSLTGARGVGRGPSPDGIRGDAWVAADLSQGLCPEALAGVEVVVHAAAETAGGYDAHQRNTIDATRRLLESMRAAGVSKLVLVSSLSVLRPPRTPWEVQDERTPRPANPRRYGAYTWGKCLQEDLVEREAPAYGIATRVVRPGALVDWRDPELPGLMGRRLFGRWHLGLGRPGLPIGVCDVERCAEAIAWCAAHFDEAPPVINLMDPSIATRADFVTRLRRDGWSGRMIWVPIGLLAGALTTARTVLSLAHGRLPQRLAAWSVLRPRRYDPRVAATVFDAVRRHTTMPAQTHDAAVHV